MLTSKHNRAKKQTPHSHIKRRVCHTATDPLRNTSSPSYNTVSTTHSALKTSLTHASKLLMQGVITSETLTQAALDQIDKTNPDTNAYLEVLRSQALTDAEASDERRAAGKPLSAIDGIPISIKDNITVLGAKTTAGSQFLKTFNSPYNATVVQRLRDAGAVIIGKTNMDEFGMGSFGLNSSYGGTTSIFDSSKAKNDDFRFIPGGSSSGSAVSLQQFTAFASIGTDTGGSVRLPAAFTGTVGFKPTYGALSRYGLVAYGSSLDSPGIMARTVADAKIVYDVISGGDENDSTNIFNTKNVKNHFNVDSSGNTAQPLKGIKVGIPQELMFNDLSPQITEIWNNTATKMSELGAELYTISIPSLHQALPVYYILAQSEAVSNLARYDGLRYGQSHYQNEKDYNSNFYYKDGSECTDETIINDPNISSLQKLYSTNRELFFGEEVKQRLLVGNFVLSSAHYSSYIEKAMAIRQELSHEIMNALYTTNITPDERTTQHSAPKVDVILCPTSTVLPSTIQRQKHYSATDNMASYIDDVMTVFANLTGIPAVSLPTAKTTADVNGNSVELPIGMQLIGAPCSDYQLLSMGEVLEKSIKL